jgi:PAS domain S-box-containing protein
MTDRSRPGSDPFSHGRKTPPGLAIRNTPTRTIALDDLFPEDSEATARSGLERIGSSAAGKLFEALPIPAILLDGSGRIVYANGACDRITPKDSTLTGRKFSSLFNDPHTARNVDSRVRKVLSKRRPKVMEGVLHTGGDEVLRRLHMRSFRVGAERSVLILIEDPPRGRVFPQAPDVSGKAAPGEGPAPGAWSMEKALKTSELTLGDILPASPVAISYFEQGKLKWANRTMMRMFRDDRREEWLGKSPRVFYPSDDEFERVREIMYEGLDKGGAVETGARFRRRDGSEFTGRIKVGAIDSKVPRKGTIVTISESSPERAGEPAPGGESPEGAGDARRLGERAAYYRTLLNNAPLGIMACDESGDITEINPQALAMLGASHADAAGGLNLLTFPPFVEAGVSSVIAGCFDSGRPAVSEFPNSIGLGRRRHCRLHVGPVRDRAKRIVGVLAVMEDVSKQKESETLLIQAERLKAVGEMAGGVAHHFNTLLQFVAGGSRKALGYLESKDYSKLRPLLEQIFDGARDSVLTVRRLQQFARARRALGVSRFSHAQREVFDLTEAVREAAKKCKLGSRADLRKGRIEVSHELDLTDGCFIEGEESEIIDVVVNLVRNAEEALPVGGRIKIKTFVKGDRAILVVRDTGVGIPSKNVGKVFEPFWTTKDGHIGMGLTSNFGIVRRHRGTITLTSTKGRGTAFTVQIPRAKIPLHKRKTLEKRVVEHSFRILLIDDDEPIVRIFERGLKKLGQTPLTAFSGQEGLKLFQEREVDIVVCDLAMPGMNGWEVARAVHQVCLERGTPKPPFILLTGWAGQLTEDEIMAHPDVNRIVEKPLKVTRLLEIAAQEVKGAVDDTAFAGRIDGIDLLEYIQVLLLAGKPAVVEVLHRNGVRGLVFIDRGRIRHAACGNLEGEEALYRCLNMRVGSFSNLPWREPERITIDQPTEYLLIEASRRRDEMNDGGPCSSE